MDGMKGYFLEPTVITNMKREMLTSREEVFAPVVGYIRNVRSIKSSTNPPQPVYI
jgi:acyl-CoA reductase-like NAD-dependent aldehyde dehydrogenase